MPEKSDKKSAEKIKLLTKSLDNLTLFGIRSRSNSGSKSRHPSPDPEPYKHYKQPLKKASPDPLKKPVYTAVVPTNNSQEELAKRFQILDNLIQQHHCLVVRSNEKVKEKVEKLRTDLIEQGQLQKSNWKKLYVVLVSLHLIALIVLFVLFSQLKNY